VLAAVKAEHEVERGRKERQEEITKMWVGRGWGGWVGCVGHGCSWLLISEKQQHGGRILQGVLARNAGSP